MIPDLRTYSRTVLRLYVQLPDTPTRSHRADRRLAAELHSRNVPLETIEAAFSLASARRICRDPSKPPLPPIRSLHYFIPAIDEVLQQPLPPGYILYLRSNFSMKPTA